MPVSKHNQVEIWRRIAKGGSRFVNYEKFKELLTEIFWVKEQADEYDRRQQNVNLLRHSDEIDEGLQMILSQDLANQKNASYRQDKAETFLIHAHIHIGTADPAAAFKKLRSFTSPFRSMVAPGERIDEKPNHFGQRRSIQQHIYVKPTKQEMRIS